MFMTVLLRFMINVMVFPGYVSVRTYRSVASLHRRSSYTDPKITELLVKTKPIKSKHEMITGPIRTDHIRKYETTES